MGTTTSIQLWYLSDGVMYSRSFRPSKSHARHWNVMAAKTLTVLKMITSSYGLTMPSRAYAETFRLYVFFAENIPSGAGLGGGSADAAYTVRALNTLFSLGLSNGAMAKIVSSIGADCPFFVYNSAMVVSGIGTTLRKVSIPTLSGLTIVICRPDGCHVSTAQAYAGVAKIPMRHPLSA